MKAQIGVFDSGIGGLTVLRTLVELVDADYIYYGDNRNAPYGEKSDEEIYRLSKGVFTDFLKMGVDLVVIACNTVTAVCIDRLRREYPFPIVGIEPALSLAKGKRLLLATKATARSDRLKRLLVKYPSVVISPPNLVEEIEKNIFSLDKVDLSFLNGYRDYDVVLGCTHYSWLKPYLQNTVYDGNRGVANRVKMILAGKDNHHDREWKPRGEKVLKTNKCTEITFIGSGFQVNFDIYKQMFE